MIGEVVDVDVERGRASVAVTGTNELGSHVVATVGVEWP